MVTKVNIKEDKFNKLILTDNDLEIRAYKFHLKKEAEILGNDIWKLQQQKNLLNTMATKLENRERDILGYSKVRVKE